MSAAYEQQVEDEISRCISHIAGELLKGRIGFLFGAGMSIPSGGIPGSRLGYEIVRRSFFPHCVDNGIKEQIQAVSKRYPLEALAAGAVEELPQQEESLSRLLTEVVFDGRAPMPHEGHIRLSAILNRLDTVRFVFTTNWDSLIEDKLGDRSEPISESSMAKIFDLDGELSDKVAVVHLHGTFDDKPLIKEQDLMSPQSALFQLFFGEFLTKSFVFVGYSVSDPNIRALFFNAADVLDRRGKKLRKLTYVVDLPRDDVDRQVSSAVWKARNAKYIPLGAEKFFIRLHEEIEMKKFREMREDISRRLGVSENQLNERIERIVSEFPDFRSSEQALLYLYSMTKGA